MDTYGPDAVITMPGLRVPPHPHIGLQTVSWLREGAIEHRDSLGSVQLVTPGELNLMTAGRGISHSEQSPRDRPPQLHGAQLWIALPEATRDVEPRFEHVTNLPQVALGDGVRATVLLGSLAGATSPAQLDSPLVGADLDVSGQASLPLQVDFEHAVVVTSGAVEVDGETLRPGRMLYLGDGRTGVAVASPERGRCLLLGGEPFEEQILMWWNLRRPHPRGDRCRPPDLDERPGRWDGVRPSRGVRRAAATGTRAADVAAARTRSDALKLSGGRPSTGRDRASMLSTGKR